MKYPEVSIIILNWNGLEDTIECLESLKKITYPNYEVIVVDNASSGNDVEVLRGRYGDYIHIIANDENYGFPEGNNIGMRYALSRGAAYILLLNNDTVVDPIFLTELVEVAESDSSIGITGSKIYFYYHPDTIQAAGGKIRWWIGDLETYDGKDIGQYDKLGDRDFLFANPMLIKKEVTEKVSLLDPFFFFGVEEYDFCIRAKRAGFRSVYVPRSVIWHKVGASKAKLSQYPETQDLIRKIGGTEGYKYYYQFFRKHWPPVLFIFPFFCHTVLRVRYFRRAFQLIWRRDWQGIKRAIRERILRLEKQWD